MPRWVGLKSAASVCRLMSVRPLCNAAPVAMWHPGNVAPWQCGPRGNVALSKVVRRSFFCFLSVKDRIFCVRHPLTSRPTPPREPADSPSRSVRHPSRRGRSAIRFGRFRLKRIPSKMDGKLADSFRGGKRMYVCGKRMYVRRKKDACSRKKEVSRDKKLDSNRFFVSKNIHY